MKLCIPTLCNYEGVDRLIRSAESGSVKPTGYIVLDNGRSDERAYTTEWLRGVLGSRSELGVVYSKGANLGVAASWNLFLEQFGQREPIVISNDDIILGSTAFALLHEYALQGTPRAGFGWALFMQHPDCTEKVGYYDENFWPGYYEDIDYIIRMRRAGVPDLRLEGAIDIQHAGWTTVHKLGDPPWLADGRAKNQSYLIAKWGTDDYGVPYAEPFNGKPPAGWDLRKRGPALPLRWDLINEIAEMIGAKTYLELGLADGSCIRRIKVADRTGVDMAAPPDVGDAVAFQCTTDEFFVQNERTFDLVFVDADHAHEQAARDVRNAIRCLNPGGVVVMHDCSPYSKDMQIVPHNGAHLWTGDVWKAIVAMRWEGQHAVRVVDSNYGLGIVIPGGTPHHFTSRPRKPEIVTYEDLVADRENLLGLVSGWEWKAWFEGAYAPLPARPFSGLAHAHRSRLHKLGLMQAGVAAEQQQPVVSGVGEYFDGVDMGMPQGIVRKYGPLEQAITQSFDEAFIKTFADPPLPEQDKLDAAVKKLEAMTPQEVFQASVRDGIHNPDGSLTEHYRAETRLSSTGRDTLVVIFSKLPRADTTGTHLLKALERLVRVEYYEPLRPRHASDGELVREDIPFVPRGYAALDLSRARSILCIDDDHGWEPVFSASPRIQQHYWCIDTYRMDAELYLGGTRRERQKHFDKVFYVQRKEAELFNGDWLPVGVDLTHYRYEPKDIVYDFCFIGNVNHARTEFLRRLTEVFPRSFVGQAYGEAANTIYNQSKLAINYSAGGDINMRMFEGQATSALLLSNTIDNGEGALLPYLPLYDSFEECARSMAFFLKNPGVRVALSERQASDMAAHTYEVRARAFLKSIAWPGF